jgi:citrate lyase beta subunit
MPVTTLVDAARTGSRPRKRRFKPTVRLNVVLMSAAVLWSAMHTPDGCGDIARGWRRVHALQVGAEELARVPSMAHRPDGTFRLVRSAPVWPTHAVAAASDAAACGSPARWLHLLFRLDQPRVCR